MLIVLCLSLVVGCIVSLILFWMRFVTETKTRQRLWERVNGLATDKARAKNDIKLVRQEIADLRQETTIAYEAKIQAMANKFSSTQKTYQSSLTALLKTNEIIRDQLDGLKKRLDSLESKTKR